MMCRSRVLAAFQFSNASTRVTTVVPYKYIPMYTAPSIEKMMKIAMRREIGEACTEAKEQSRRTQNLPTSPMSIHLTSSLSERISQLLGAGATSGGGAQM